MKNINNTLALRNAIRNGVAKVESSSRGDYRFSFTQKARAEYASGYKAATIAFIESERISYGDRTAELAIAATHRAFASEQNCEINCTEEEFFACLQPQTLAAMFEAGKEDFYCQGGDLHTRELLSDCAQEALEEEAFAAE